MMMKTCPPPTRMPNNNIYKQLAQREVLSWTNRYPTWDKNIIPSRLKIPLSKYLSPSENKVLLGFASDGNSLLFYGIAESSTFKNSLRLYWKDFDSSRIIKQVELFDTDLVPSTATIGGGILQNNNSTTITTTSSSGTLSLSDRELFIWQNSSNICIVLGYDAGCFFNDSDVSSSNVISSSSSVCEKSTTGFYTGVSITIVLQQQSQQEVVFHYRFSTFVIPHEESLRPKPFQLVGMSKGHYILILQSEEGVLNFTFIGRKAYFSPWRWAWFTIDDDDDNSSTMSSSCFNLDEYLTKEVLRVKVPSLRECRLTDYSMRMCHVVKRVLTSVVTFKVRRNFRTGVNRQLHLSLKLHIDLQTGETTFSDMMKNHSSCSSVAPTTCSVSANSCWKTMTRNTTICPRNFHTNATTELTNEAVHRMCSVSELYNPVYPSVIQIE